MTVMLGLTGAIGTGKTTTAQMFAAEGIPVWDADAAVHLLYAKGGAAVRPLAAAFPAAIVDGAVDRTALKREILNDPNALSLIESIVHPLVAKARQTFIEETDSDIILFDIPLLYETGADLWLDAVVVVSAPPEMQRARVLARPGMTEEQFRFILSRQLPDAEKRARADYVIETLTLEGARDAVKRVIADIRNQDDA